ncbi:DUF3800 domain-containing protein [Pseudomonas atacamensis]|uniref:DUF3800 domain-containing protein n=1 Tax=Pseudomonas atacamensis TaxID=2565368 RepID=UPI001CBA9319|nr:DUF3800 domain-containing protein [Pseudomonas atacamensis]
MTKIFIYLDESGDLGWKFDAPYRNGGSSRYLTIAALVASEEKRHLPKRLIKKLYQKFNWPATEEKKWSGMNAAQRLAFATASQKMLADNPGHFRYISITVKKENVRAHIRSDENKLYNYMIATVLLDEMSKYDEVNFVPDPRSVKVKSGNSLHDYLQTQLWFENDCETIIITRPCDSMQCHQIQFSDMLSGLVQTHFEDGNSAPWAVLRDDISYQTLFF